MHRIYFYLIEVDLYWLHKVPVTIVTVSWKSGKPKLAPSAEGEFPNAEESCCSSLGFFDLKINLDDINCFISPWNLAEPCSPVRSLFLHSIYCIRSALMSEFTGLCNINNKDSFAIMPSIRVSWSKECTVCTIAHFPAVLWAASWD